MKLAVSQNRCECLHTLLANVRPNCLAFLQVLLFPAMKPDAAEKPATDGVAALSIVSAAVG